MPAQGLQEQLLSIVAAVTIAKTTIIFLMTYPCFGMYFNYNL
ncbi:MAG: hypothetical protein QM652_13940 [Legionella sp.]